LLQEVDQAVLADLIEGKRHTLPTTATSQIQ
jgi:hypothetical protein